MKRIAKLLCISTLGCAAMACSVSARAAVTDQDKQFLKMVVEHEALAMHMKPYADAWGLTPPSTMDSDHQAEYDKLNGLSGADFDKEYMNVMEKDHHDALDLFNEEAKTTTDMKFKSAVMHGQSVVAAHTHMADSLGAKLS
jgi:putative membrane protein